MVLVRGMVVVLWVLDPVLVDPVDPVLAPELVYPVPVLVNLLELSHLLHRAVHHHK